MAPINLNLNSSLAQSIQAATNLIGNVVNGFVVSPNGAPPGVSGFLFSIIDTEEMSVESDVTDHFVEENYAIQDHVALKPIHFKLKGYQGELVNIAGQPFNPILNTILALAPLTQVNPLFNEQDSQVYEDIAQTSAQAENVINQIPSIFSLISNLTNVQTSQQAALNFFMSMRNNRQLVTIQTPYGLLTNYIIEDFNALQAGDSRFMSTFSVTFKQIQVVSTAVTPTAASPNPAGASTNQTVQSSNANQSNNSNPQPPTQFSDNPTLSPDDLSGRLLDMNSDFVQEGQTPGVGTFPNMTPPVPVTVPNVFPTTNPIFQTLPSMNMAMPGFIPAGV